MIINWTLIVLAIIGGVIFGIIAGALWIIISQMVATKQARKDYKNGKNIMETKDNPKQVVSEEVPIPVPEPQVVPEEKKDIMDKDNSDLKKKEYQTPNYPKRITAPKVPEVPIPMPIPMKVPEVPTPMPMPEPEIKERNYDKDLKLFNKANKKLVKLKKMYEKGKLTHQELTQEFAYYKEQDYYKHISEKQNAKK